MINASGSLIQGHAQIVINLQTLRVTYYFFMHFLSQPNKMLMTSGQACMWYSTEPDTGIVKQKQSKSRGSEQKMLRISNIERLVVRLTVTFKNQLVWS